MINQPKHQTNQANLRPEPVPHRVTAQEAVEAVILKYDSSTGGRERSLDVHTATAVRQWIEIQEPCANHERGYLKTKTDGKKVWITPYEDSLVSLLHSFLKHPIDEQNYIIAGSKSGVHWRGEYFRVYKNLVETIEDMHDNET